MRLAFIQCAVVLRFGVTLEHIDTECDNPGGTMFSVC